MSKPEPEMGANTTDILIEHGYSKDQIEKMQIEGIVSQTSLNSRL